MGNTAIAVKNANPALAGAGKAVEDMMGMRSIIEMMRAKMRRKICPSTSRASKFIHYPVISGIISKRLIVNPAIEFIIQAPNNPIMVRIATIFGTNVRVWS